MGPNGGIVAIGSGIILPYDYGKIWQRLLPSTSPAGQAKVIRRIWTYTFSRQFVLNFKQS
jgi:hypothetical protein